MALTDQNRADIRYYLGYSARYFHTDTVLESAMSSLESDPEASTQVLADIVKCQDIDTRLEATYDRLKALQVCDITLAHKKELCVLRSEGRRYVGRIASTIGVPVRHDVYGSGMYSSSAAFYGLKPGGNFGLQG